MHGKINLLSPKRRPIWNDTSLHCQQRPHTHTHTHTHIRGDPPPPLDLLIELLSYLVIYLVMYRSIDWAVLGVRVRVVSVTGLVSELTVWSAAKAWLTSRRYALVSRPCFDRLPRSHHQTQTHTRRLKVECLCQSEYGLFFSRKFDHFLPIYPK